MGIFFAILSDTMILVQGPILGKALKKFSEDKLVVIGSLILGTNFVLFVLSVGDNLTSVARIMEPEDIDPSERYEGADRLYNIRKPPMDWNVRYHNWLPHFDDTLTSPKVRKNTFYQSQIRAQILSKKQDILGTLYSISAFQ
jgi:hypothetical protein